MKATVDDVIVCLLQSERVVRNFIDRVEATGIEVTFDYDPLGIVLDLLTVPDDNVIETNAADISILTGKWPEGAYCRDSWYDDWEEWEGTPREFIQYARESLIEWANGGENPPPAENSP